MTDHLAVGDRVLLDTSFDTARIRMELLVRAGILPAACEAAYGEGTTSLVRAAGPAAGLTRLAASRVDDLVETPECAHITLQWEAIAADGKLFTALDADLMLAPAGNHLTALALAGAYRPQPGPAGAGLDRAIVHECAMRAIHGFLERVACALAHPAGTAGPAVTDRRIP